MKGIVKPSGNGFHVMIPKSKGFSEGDEVLVIHYDKSKDKTRCKFDASLVKDAVAEALAETRGSF